MGTGVAPGRVATGNFLIGSLSSKLAFSKFAAWNRAISTALRYVSMEAAPPMHMTKCVAFAKLAFLSHAFVPARTIFDDQPNSMTALTFSLRKEVIQPHLPIRLPCYDLAPINSLTFGALFLAVREATSGTAIFHGLTGGVYKARERIHRAMADARLLANPTSWSRVADSNPN